MGLKLDHKFGKLDLDLLFSTKSSNNVKVILVISLFVCGNVKTFLDLEMYTKEKNVNND